MVDTPFENLDLALRDYDWFSFDAQAGQTISINAYFTHETGDIDIYLYHENNTENHVAFSYSTDDNEAIEYVVETGGAHLLKVELFTQGIEPDRCLINYRLTIDVRD